MSRKYAYFWFFFSIKNDSLWAHSLLKYFNLLNTSNLESCPFHFGSLQIWKPIWKLRLYELSWLWTVTNLWSALIVINGLQKQNNCEWVSPTPFWLHLHLFDFPFIKSEGPACFAIAWNKFPWLYFDVS